MKTKGRWFKRVIEDPRWQEVERLIDKCQELTHVEDEAQLQYCHDRLSELGQILRKETE